MLGGRSTREHGLGGWGFSSGSGWRGLRRAGARGLPGTELGASLRSRGDGEAQSRPSLSPALQLGRALREAGPVLRWPKSPPSRRVPRRQRRPPSRAPAWFPLSSWPGVRVEPRAPCSESLLESLPLPLRPPALPLSKINKSLKNQPPPTVRSEDGDLPLQTEVLVLRSYLPDGARGGRVQGEGGTGRTPLPGEPDVGPDPGTWIGAEPRAGAHRAPGAPGSFLRGLQG